MTPHTTNKHIQSYSDRSNTVNMSSISSTRQSDAQSTVDSVENTTQHQSPAPVTLTSSARVVVTGHQEDGTSVFVSDEQVEPFAPFGPANSSFIVFDSRESVPLSNQDAPREFPQVLPRCPPTGVKFAVTNLPPGNYSVPMHRTLSVDYAAVLTGEIVLRLDGGEERTVRAGEFIIQGGANHSWINRGHEVCRIAFLMVGADKVRLASGEELEETVFKKQQADA